MNFNLLPTLNARQLLQCADGALDESDKMFEEWYLAHGWQHADGTNETQESMRLTFLAGVLLYERVREATGDVG